LDRLQRIKTDWSEEAATYHFKQLALEEQDIEWLIEQAEKVEQYQDALKTIIKLTTCDDTWDFANRTLEGKQRIELTYRFNKA
jgi:oligoendopeptidase F